MAEDIKKILEDYKEETKGYVIEMFGRDRVIACCSEEVPQKLGNVIRVIRGI